MTSNYRTDRHNNPAAFTTDIARQAGLAFGVDYDKGDAFNVAGTTYFTARLLGDPVATTIKVVDAIGFYNKSGAQRWVYIGFGSWLWDSLTPDQKKRIVGDMYEHEGGIDMKGLFA